MKIITKSDIETIALGKHIGALLNNNTAVYLIGDMASGKTQLSRGVAESLGLLEEFSSPTYTIINEYKNDRDVLYHMDAYRIEDISELDYIGFYDIYKNEKIIIEWADMIMSELENFGLWVEIKKSDSDFNLRHITVKSFDKQTDLILKKLEEMYE